MKCPKCGGTEVDPQRGYFEDGSFDTDPICKNCEYPVGDDWINEV